MTAKQLRWWLVVAALALGGAAAIARTPSKPAPAPVHASKPAPVRPPNGC
jgi:hypothetical protein